MASPRLARLLAAALLPRHEREFIVGDMEELYAWRVARDGRQRATVLYVKDALLSVMSRLRWLRRSHRTFPSQRDRKPPMIAGFGTDARAAVRRLRREPGFVMVATFTLALGIGSTAAVFGMINQLVLRPLPGATATDGAGYLYLASAADPERFQGQSITTLDFDVLRREATLLEGIASYGLSRLTLRVPNRRPIAVYANRVYGDFFEVLGVRPVEGRLLAAQETDLLANPLVAVISEKLRATLFSSTEEVVGRTLQMNNQPVTILGVAGGGFSGPQRGDDIDVWIPYPALVPLVGFQLERLRDRNSIMHGDFVVRLRDGVSGQAAEAQLSSILTRLAEASVDHRDHLANLRPRFHPRLHIAPMWRPGVYESLRVLAIVVLLVLMIACANVANLLLVRNVKRRGSLAMHRALGASTARIARHHLLDSLFLAFLGTVAGFFIAWLIGVSFRGEQIPRMPAFEGLALDWRVLAFAGAASAVTAVLFGTVPALLAGRFNLGAALKSSGQRETGRVASLRAVLSAGQIALSLALLVGGVLLTRTVRNLYAVDTGLDITNVLALPLDTPDGVEGPALDAWNRDVMATIGAVPGVTEVALDMYGPHGSRMMGRIGLPGTPREELTSAQMVPVTPGWFEMFGVRTRSGRTFEARDWSLGTNAGLILTASLARRLFGSDDVVGRRVAAGFGEAEEREIIGVLEDMRMAYAPDEPQEAMFVSYNAAPSFRFVTVLIRVTRVDPALGNEIRTAVEAIVPEEAIPDPTPLTERVDAIHAERRVFSRLLALLSALAVLLAAVGLYGVIAFDVAGRRREFGIRLALGARRERIGRLVARYAASIIGAGIALGVAAAYALSRVLENRLFGVEPTDAGSYLLGALLFTAVAALACLVPVLNAVRVNPVVTLKEE